MLSWESTSCNGMRYFNRGRGSLIEGTNGTVLVDRDGYEIYDLNGKKTASSELPKPRPPPLTSSAPTP